MTNIENNTTPVIGIYGAIGLQANFSNFAKELNALKNESEILIDIFSPGGSVSEGFQIYNAIKRHPAKFTARIDSLAGSIATIIAMAADKIQMSTGALFLIHKPFLGTGGNSDELRKKANDLDKIEKEALKVYSEKSSQNQADIKKWMQEETPWNAETAKKRGFIDEILESEKVQKMSVSLKNMKKIFNKWGENEPQNNRNNKKNNMESILNKMISLGGLDPAIKEAQKPLDEKQMLEGFENAMKIVASKTSENEKLKNQKILEAERSRVADILFLGKNHNLINLALDAINNKTSANDFKDIVLENISKIGDNYKSKETIGKKEQLFNGSTMSIEEFQNLTHEGRNDFFKNGGKL